MRFALSLLTLITFVHPASGVPSFTILGTRPAGLAGVTVNVISADGTTIVGGGSTLAGMQAFRWTAATGITPITGPGGYPQEARAVSADGSVIVGASLAATGGAFRWTQAEGVESLGTLPGGNNFGAAYGVSAEGQVIVGENNGAGFRWTEQTGMTALPGGYPARGISADGSVIFGYDFGVAQGVRWTAQDGASSLGPIAPVGTSADGSTIVGASQGEAARWTEGEGVVQLGFLGHAAGVSADGSVIVGTGPLKVGGGYIWDQAHGVRNLEAVLVGLGLDLQGWHIYTASGISADGLTVTGLLSNPSGGREAYIARLPEPGTISVLCLGGLFVLRRPRKH